MKAIIPIGGGDIPFTTTKIDKYIISLAKSINKYFDDEKPWVTIKNNREKCAQSMYICIQYIGNLSNLIEPFMPFTAEKIRGFLGIKEPTWMPIEIKEGKIHDIHILFERIDKSVSDEEIQIEYIKRTFNGFKIICNIIILKAFF